MRKRTYIVIILWIISALCLALAFAVKHADGTIFVRTNDLLSTPGVHLLDPNTGIFKIISREPNHANIKWIGTSIHMEGCVCVKKLKNSRNVQVLGELNNGKNYPVVLDTGYSRYVGITDTIVTDAGLPIYPMDDLGHHLIGGLCNLSQLRIGTVTIRQPPCEYFSAHYERRILGITTWKEMEITLGLGLLKKFSYIHIDNVEREIEFSGKQPFSTQDENQWNQYPMVIERNEKGNAKLMVDIPIAGNLRHIAFDTGSASGLTLTEKMWTEVSPSLKLVHEENHTLTTPLEGRLSCRRITVELLRLGSIPIRSAQISVTANNNPFGQDDFTLGMGFLKETVIVLDFKSKLLWIRNPTKPAISPTTL
ncbi:hypothetical protein ACFL3Q_06360 [Planctomycetota bacterium]